MEDFFDTVNGAQLLGVELIDAVGLWQMLLRYVFNFVVTGTIIHFFYYPKSRRRDYYFTFTMIALSVFFIIFLLGGVKLKVGFVLGVFAIFGIIRYRTESVPIREMTYLFTITAIAVINGLSVQMSYVELLVVNLIFVLVAWGLESEKWLKHVSCKWVLYDNIQLITPDRYGELLQDISLRTGLKVQRIEVGHIDFLRDSAMLKVYYESASREANTADNITKFPSDNERL
ncbi:MAG: DUF4956 domain-containing protein [Tannerella sp.]|jgi:hypothetical protein|nr:DUF4956 domain-containing protein [Tannerella sp.]